MKKIISKLLYTALILCFAAACVPEEYGTTFDYSPFVQVTTPVVSVQEFADPGTATVKLQYVGPTLSQDLTVNLGVTLDGPGGDVTLPGNSVVIKAGEFTATTEVDFANNFINDGNKVVTIKVLSTSMEDVQVATPASQKDNAVVTIVDDDCPFDISEYGGAYSADFVFEADFLYGAGEYLDNPVNLELSEDGTMLIDPDFIFLSDGGTAVPVSFKLDPITATATIAGEPFTFLDGSSDDNAVYAYNDTPNRRFFTNDAVPGALSTCEKSFTITATIRREDGTTPQHLTVKYTKK